VALPVEAHCHNDYGLGLANATAAYGAGASVIRTSINVLGYRWANAATKEVSVALPVLCGKAVPRRMTATQEYKVKRTSYASK